MQPRTYPSAALPVHFQTFAPRYRCRMPPGVGVHALPLRHRQGTAVGRHHRLWASYFRGSESSPGSAGQRSRFPRRLQSIARCHCSDYRRIVNPRNSNAKPPPAFFGCLPPRHGGYEPCGVWCGTNVANLPRPRQGSGTGCRLLRSRLSSEMARFGKRPCSWPIGLAYSRFAVARTVIVPQTATKTCPPRRRVMQSIPLEKCSSELSFAETSILKRFPNLLMPASIGFGHVGPTADLPLKMTGASYSPAPRRDGRRQTAKERS
jgi:hypothetical protein